MTTAFPGALDTFTNPSPSDSMAGPPSHSDQHGAANDALAAVQAKVGIDGSSDPLSLDFLIKKGFGYNVKFAGAIGDGATDDTAAIQACINAVGARGGGMVYMPDDNFKITATLLIGVPGVCLMGEGPDTNHNVSFSASGTRLTWAGAPSGVMLSVYTPNIANAPTVSGVTVKGIKFNCADIAATAIEAISLGFCAFEDLNVYNPAAQGVNLYCQALTEVPSIRRCTFKRISVRCLDGVSAPSAHGFVLNGLSGGNACFNTFEGIQVLHKNGVGVKIIDGDNNLFLSTYCFRAAAGTGYGVELHGAANANLAARSNHFLHLSANGGIKAFGTTTYTAPSKQNNVWFYDRENGCPDPVLETGATLFLHDDKGGFEKLAAIQAVFAQTQANLDAQRAAMGTESLRLHHGGSNHAILTDGANAWGINIDSSTGDIRITRSAGNGAISLGAGSTDVKIRGHALTHGTVAPTTGAWLVGDRCWNSVPSVGQPKGWLCTAAGTPGTWASEGNL